MFNAFSPTSNVEMCADWVVDPKYTFAAIDKTNYLIPDVTKIVVSYLRDNNNFFGEEQWDDLDKKSFCGRVDPAPPLSLDIEIYLQSRCLAFPQKKTADGTPVRVKDTHMVVFIPKIVGGKLLTLNSFGMIVKNYFPGTHVGYRDFFEGLVTDLGDRPIDRSHWAIMTIDLLPESRGKTPPVQQVMIENLAKKVLVPYELPNALPATICILAKYINSFDSSKTCLFGDSPWTYTCCKEKSQGYRVIVGGFSQAGLIFRVRNVSDGLIGAAALWKNLSHVLTLKATPKNTVLPISGLRQP